MEFFLHKTRLHFLRIAQCIVLMLAAAAQAQTTSIFTDASLTAKTVAAYGDAKIVTGQSKFSGPVGTFDGAGDYLVVSPSALDASPKAFTIETWIYMSSVPANGWPIVSQSASGTDGEQQLFVSGSNGGSTNQNKLRFSRGTGVGNVVDLIGSTTLPLNQWVHIALSVDGAIAKLFVNGNLDASIALTSGWVDTAQNFYVGTTLNSSAPANQSFAIGKISDLRITKNSARYKNSFIPFFSQVIENPLSDRDFSDVTLLLTGNMSSSTSIVDASQSFNTVNTYGNTQQSTGQSKFGGSSIYFDGSGDYLSVPARTDFQFGTGDFTVEAWVNFESLPKVGEYAAIIGNRGSQTSNNQFSIFYGGTEKFYFYYSLNGSTQTAVIPVGQTAALINTWYHVALVRNETSITLYIDGASVANVKIGTSSLYPTTANLMLGAIGYSNPAVNYFFRGHMDDVRITKGIARYIANFTPSEIPPSPVKTGDAQWSKVSFLLNANGTSGSTKIADLSPSAKSISVSGDSKIATGQSKFGGASLLFDGNGDSISTSYSESFNLSNTSFTIEAWSYVTAYSGSSVYGTILSKRSGGADFDYGVYLNGVTKELLFIYGTTAAGRNDIGSGANTILLNTWNHFAVSFDGSVIKLFLNGNLVSSQVMNGTLKNRGLPLEIGKSLSYGDSFFSGYIDDLRITKGVARYATNFTPPTAQLEPSRFVKDPYSNRVSLLLLSGAGAVDSVPPYVTSTTKQVNANSALESVTFNFSKAMEPTSFLIPPVTLTDATQKIIPISSITQVSSTSFRVNFASPVLAGTYSLKIWPDALGANGLALDQNRNGVGGEPGDALEQSVVVNYASPVVVTPTISGESSTGTSMTLSWPAYVTPANGRDITKYRIYTSTTPYTTIGQATKVLEVAGTATSATLTGLMANTTYYVTVVAVDSSGAFISQATPIAVKAVGATEQTTAYTYNAAGQILTEDGPRTDVNDITTYTYDASGNRATMTNALGHLVRYNAYDAMGRLLSMTDANGITSTFTYSERGWLLSSTIKHPSNAALDSITTYTYDAVGQMLTMTMPNGHQLGYEYDGARRLTAIKNVAGERIEYTLDAAGNRTQQTIKSSAGTIAYSVVQAFDELSRVMSITGNHNQNEQHQYDTNDNTTAVTDGRSNKTRQTFDALNRITKVIDPALKETGFTYDTQNRINTVTDARGNVTTYTYDGLGNLVTQTSPDTGTTRFSYDAAGNRTSMQDARGVVVNYTYDALNRLTSVSYPAATSENITYTYDVTGTGNYGLGRLNKVTNGSASITYGYNHLGLISQKVASTNSLPRTLSYAYDTSGNLTGITYPAGRIVTYVRDSAGRVQAIKTKFNSAATEQTVISAVSYLPFGPVKSYTYGNGLTHTLSYDNDYRLTDIVLGGLMARRYNYDAADNITQILDNVSATKNQTFTYDNLDRLTSANGSYGYQAFSYDGVGNRTGTLVDNGTTILSDTYNYDATSNRLSRIDKTSAGLASGTRNFSYDSAGNLIQGTPETGSDQLYTYNKANRLINAKVGTTVLGTYVYDALGQRVSKTYTDGTKELFYYDEAGQLLAVTNGSGTVLREYLYNGNTLVGYINAGILTYIHNDHHNTPQVVTAQNQSVLWIADYEPFGKTKLNANNTITFGARFPGQYLDSETGNYYNYFRDYDLSIGRYIESDPIGLDGGINTYAYVQGNPISFVDPFGLMGYGGGHSTGNPKTKPYRGSGPFGPVCGPAGNPVAASWIPDGPMKKACQKHDDCYATCGKSKAQCDEALLSEGSMGYFLAVSAGAQSAYDDAQKKCKDECKK